MNVIDLLGSRHENNQVLKQIPSSQQRESAEISFTRKKWPNKENIAIFSIMFCTDFLEP
jgi:hypothetical protein